MSDVHDLYLEHLRHRKQEMNLPSQFFKFPVCLISFYLLPHLIISLDTYYALTVLVTAPKFVTI